jgi:hypothetical protein
MPNKIRMREREREFENEKRSVVRRVASWWMDTHPDPLGVNSQAPHLF